jgi:hypothetical protein
MKFEFPPLTMTIPDEYFYLVGSINLSESELKSLCKEIEDSSLGEDAKMPEDGKAKVRGKRRKRESLEEYTEEKKVPMKRLRESSRKFR